MNPIFFAYANNAQYSPRPFGSAVLAVQRAVVRTLTWPAMPGGCTYSVKVNGTDVATGLTSPQYTGTFAKYDVVQVRAVLPTTGTVLFTYPAIAVTAEP